MGGWDTYCFICATGLDLPFELEGDEESEGSGENDSDHEDQLLRLKALFPKERMFHRLQWLTKFRTIGENRHASGLTTCYITGPAEAADYGQAIIQLGDHPNAKELDDDSVRCYRDGEAENGDLPVHDNCFAILCKVFARAQGSDYQWTPETSSTSLPFDLDSLFSCLASTRREFRAYLDLDHGLEPDQYFCVDWERIFDYFDPLEDMEIPSFAVDQASTDAFQDAKEPSLDGKLDTLPLELILQILDAVPQADLLSLMRASSTVLRATRPNEFWERRLRLDGPWLWECRSGETKPELNWQSFYNKVMMQAHKPLKEAAKGAHVSGLANRRRIWHVCEQILKLYLQKHRLCGPQHMTSIFEEGVMCRYLPMVATRTLSQFKGEAAFFFKSQREMALEKRLTLKWNAEDALCGMTMETEAGKVTFGHFDASQGTESAMVIQPDDWIEKLVLNISVVFVKNIKTQYGDKREERLAITGIDVWTLSGGVTTLGEDGGHKRLLEPLPHNGIVGLKSQFSQGVITHLGLLEHSAGRTKSRSPNDPNRLNLLWNDHFPSAELRVKDYYKGYWTGDHGSDLVPMHTLLFGSTDLEQSRMTGIGITADLTCFEVYRSDGSFERVGQHQAPLKTFLVDGPGGERIAGFEWTIGHLPVGLTIVTTTGRQAVFGRRRDNAIHGHTSEHGYGVAGLYCSFSYKATGKDLLSSLGLIQSPHLERSPMDDDRLEDGNNLFWEPRPPPRAWHAIGPVWGSGHHGEVAVCIDFARPVVKIEGLFPAPEWLAEIELGGFVIHYGDGNSLEPVSHLGFPPLSWPNPSDATSEKLRTMHRYPGMSISFTKDKDTGEAHVSTDEEALTQPTTWDLGERGERIVAATIWAGEYLHGIQFHSQSGQNSPRWGKCGGKHAAVICAGGEDRIVGLKMMLGARRIGHTAPTLSPQAVQAMSDR